MGKKRSKQFVLKHTNSAAKIVGEKSSGKSAKERFLYYHEYRDQKMVGKNARNNFSRNTWNSESKKCWEKIVGKK